MDELALLKGFRLEDAAVGDARDHARRTLTAAIARQRARRRYAVAAALAGAAVLTGAAYGVVRELIVGDPAPPEVTEQLARFGQEADLIPYKRPDAPETKNLRVVAVLDSSVGRAYLFGTPDGRCGWTWIEGDRTDRGRVNMSSACGDGKQTFWAVGRQQLEGREVRLFSGWVAPGVARVGVRFGKTSLTIPLAGRWFFAELSRDPTAVVTYDRAGDVVREYPVFPLPRPGARPTPRPHQLGEARELLRIDAREGREVVALEVARATNGGSCMIVRSDEKPANRGCGIRPPGPREIAVAPMQFGGASPVGIQLLVGPVGAEIARLRVRFQDGRVDELPLRERWTLYEVVRADYEPGRRPVELVGLDAAGKVVATERLPWG
jgi:hypothetical protein